MEQTFWKTPDRSFKDRGPENERRSHENCKGTKTRPIRAAAALHKKVPAPSRRCLFIMEAQVSENAKIQSTGN